MHSKKQNPFLRNRAISPSISQRNSLSQFKTKEKSLANKAWIRSVTLLPLALPTRRRKETIYRALVPSSSQHRSFAFIFPRSPPPHQSRPSPPPEPKSKETTEPSQLLLLPTPASLPRYMAATRLHGQSDSQTLKNNPCFRFCFSSCPCPEPLLDFDAVPAAGFRA